MEQFSVEEIIRDLLVYLKGQAPLLETMDSKEAIIEQIQVMATGLRETLNKLDEAINTMASSQSEETEELSEELKAAEEKRKQLEDSLEKLTKETESLKENHKETETKLNEKLDKIEEINQKLNEEKGLNEKFVKEIDELKTKLETAQEAQKLEDKVKTLEEEFARQLGEINQFKEQETQLKDEIEELKEKLEGKKEELTKATNLDNNEEYLEIKEELKKELKNLAQCQKEKEILGDRFSRLKEEYNKLIEASKNNETELAEASGLKLKAKILEEEQVKTVALLGTLKGQLDEATETLNKNSLERQQYVQQIQELENTLKTVVNAQEELANQYKGRFALSAEDCVSIFDTLTLTQNRLIHSIENKDLYEKVMGTLNLLKKSNAIQQVATVGQIYDPEMHRVIKSFVSNILPDNIVIHEESTGFITGGKLIEKAKVWISKSKFVCTDCGNLARAHEYFCPKCGLELAAPEGTSKQLLQPIPKDLKIMMQLVDNLIKQGQLETAKNLIEELRTENPDNTELEKRMDIIITANSNVGED